MVILGISIVLLAIMICGGIAYPLITKMAFKDRYRKSNIIEEEIKTLLITDMKRPQINIRTYYYHIFYYHYINQFCFNNSNWICRSKNSFWTG